MEVVGLEVINLYLPTVDGNFWSRYQRGAISIMRNIINRDICAAPCMAIVKFADDVVV